METQDIDGGKAQQLRILSDSLTEGASFFIGTTVSMSGLAEGYTEISIEVNLGPQGGTAKVQPSLGKGYMFRFNHISLILRHRRLLI